jgi:Phage integrase family
MEYLLLFLSGRHEERVAINGPALSGEILWMSMSRCCRAPARCTKFALIPIKSAAFRNRKDAERWASSIESGILRRGEVVKLRWGSLEFNRRLLTVEGRNAKNRQTRHVPLNDEAVSVPGQTAVAASA